ncbi:MAG: DASS family sodium-coupled anion symporter [Acidobacteria bacterium]|nr:DASS family sodium-coupled anion symporter [Acidobacteriota bacterium]
MVLDHQPLTTNHQQAAAPSVRPVPLWLAACIGVAIWLLPRPDAVDPRAWRLLAIFVATIVGIIAKPLPIGAVAFVGIAATLATGTLTLAEALSGFTNGPVWLVMAAFFLASGFIRTGLGERIAYILVTLFGRSTLGLGYSFAASDLVLAPMIPSNTARAGGVIFPVLQSLARTVLAGESAEARRTRAFLTLSAYNATVITSAMFVTAMVANPLIVQIAAGQDVAITWTTWAVAAAVPGAVSLLVMPPLLYVLTARRAVMRADAPDAARAALRRLGPMKRSERVMATVAVVLLGAWIAGSSTGLDPTAAALMAVAALLVTGVLGWDAVAGDREAWNTFVWFATLVMMATYLGELGLIAWFTEQVKPLVGGVGWLTGFAGLVLVYFYTHYFFASMTAHVSAMYAPFLAVALALGTPPVLAALVLGFSSNLFASLTHYGTAAAPILFSGGHVPLGTWWRIGLIVSFVNIAIWVGIGAVWWRLLGLW